MTEYKIHDSVPSGFTYANEQQRKAFDATGSVPGASKVALVRADSETVRGDADVLQAGGPDEYPRGYYEYLAVERTARLAIRLRPPRTWGDVVSPVARRWAGLTGFVVSNDDNAEARDWYVNQYNAGWAAAGRSGDSAAWDSGQTSAAWDDGYLDRAAGRAKWHLTWCLDHDECGEG